MFNKLLIVGDSHTFRLKNTYYYHYCKDGTQIICNNDETHECETGKFINYFYPIDRCFWGLGNDAKIINGVTKYEDVRLESHCKEYHIEKMIKEGIGFDEIYFSGHKGASGYASHYMQNSPCIKTVADDNTIIAPFFGYIDIKQKIPWHNNPEYAAKHYIEKTLNFWNNKKIIFIEPIPQFVNNLGSGYPLFPFDLRYDLHTRFIKSFRETILEKGLIPSFSPEKLFGFDSFDETYECHRCFDCLRAPADYPDQENVKLDHLYWSHNKKILDGFIEYAKKYKSI